MQPGDGVTKTDIGADRMLAWASCHIPKASDALSYTRVAGLGRVGARLAPARYSSNDEPRIDSLKIIRAKAPFFHRAGFEVLKQNINARGKVANNLLTSRVAKVQRDTFLVPAQDVPPKCGSFVHPAPLTQGVPLSRWLNLDHLGAKPSQEKGRKGASQ